MEGIVNLYRIFSRRDVVDQDFKDCDVFPPGSRIYSKVQWEKRKKELLKTKLPDNSIKYRLWILIFSIKRSLF
jgi:hypothetical protein